MATVTLNPSTDAKVYRNVSQESWGSLVAGSGTNINQSANVGIVYWESGSSTNQWRTLARFIMVFDTSAINGIINSATLSIYGTGKNNDNGLITPNINIYAATPANTASLAATDYANVGNTAFSSTISYASWNTSGYNDFVLNASGLANINNGGKSSFSARWVTNDVGNTAPSAWANTAYTQLVANTSANATNKPKLIIDYTPLSASFFMFM